MFISDEQLSLYEDGGLALLAECRRVGLVVIRLDYLVFVEHHLGPLIIPEEEFTKGAVLMLLGKPR